MNKKILPMGVDKIIPRAYSIINMPAVIVLASLSFLGCDLLNNKPEIDLEQTIDDTVAWANAARLTVEVYYPESWGRSPQFGPLSSDNARQGFPFTVEFTVSAAYGFAGWRAYRTGDLGDKSQAALEGATPLTTVEAAISGNRDGGALVTINITEAVTLIPWCEDRPRITQTNPPLINSGISYTRGQQIKIWFATGLAAETVQFGEGFIEISGQTIGESSEPYDDLSTSTVNENGDLTGRAAGASRFFKNPEYDPVSGTITIRPGDGAGGTKLPPGDIVITVTVGTNVRSPNGNGMVSPVSFYYRTNTLEVKNVYTAENIWAIHKPAVAPSVEKFFYTGAPTDRDRRLRKNVSGNYEVTLYFTVNRSNPTGMTDPPDKFNIAELHYANLAGGEAGSLTREGTCTVDAVETGAGTAGALYRQNNSGAGAYYKITCEWATLPQPGIIRLIVLPYRDTDGDGDYSDTGDIAPDTWGNAHAEGHFAAVVLDNQSPSGSANLSLSGAASVSGGVYYYGGTYKTMTLTGDFSGVADNGGYGIPLIAASIGKPWTMENSGSLEWKYQIVVSMGTSYESSWFAFDASASAVDLSTAIPNANMARTINLKYRDSLENESPWLDSGVRVSYYDAVFSPITVWNASYNEGANTITVNWTNPTEADFDHTELVYSVNGGNETRVSIAKPGNSYTFSGVPHISTANLLTTNISGYTVKLEAHSLSSGKAPAVVKLWNIPGMSVSDTAPAEEIRTQAELAAMVTGSANKKYVLINDITLSGIWTPKGTGSDAFTGKFYGNGHKITFGAGADLGGSAHRGLFGYTSGAAEIRDLEVFYTNTAASGSAGIYAGGIAGYAVGTSILRNCVTGGSLGVTNTNSSSTTWAGGFAGFMEGTATAENGRAALNLSVNSGTGSVYAGGLTGRIAGGGGGERVVVSGIDIPGDLSVTKSADGAIYAGGAAGESQSGKLAGVDYSGRVRVNRTIGIPAGTTCLGGITGRLENASMDTCSFTGVLDIPETDGSAILYAGGLTGDFRTKGEITNSSAKGDISYKFRGNGEVSVGRLAGYMSGSGDTSRVVLVNSHYSDGAVLAVSSGTGTIRAGGVTGSLMRYGEISNCRSLARSVMAYKTAAVGGSIYIGGFAGGMIQTAISGGSSTSPVSVPPEHQGTGTVNIGGFVGQFYNHDGFSTVMEGCYATGAVSAYGGGALYAGGLIGASQISTTNPAGTNSVTRSYATGAVYAETSSTGYAGGLVGWAGNVDISESYATGAVTLRKKSSSNNIVYAGGLAGYVQIDAAKTVQYNFAGGAVTAQSADTGAVGAGGVAGYKASGGFSNNAAFGEKITVKGSGTNSKGRIYAGLAGTAASANHALNAMYLGEASSYYACEPVYAVAASTDAASANGYDAAFTAFRETSFWQTLGFPVARWNFAGLARGYPYLSWQ
jgi:hypothetical protein